MCVCVYVHVMCGNICICMYKCLYMCGGGVRARVCVCVCVCVKFEVFGLCGFMKDLILE